MKDVQRSKIKVQRSNGVQNASSKIKVQRSNGVQNAVSKIKDQSSKDSKFDFLDRAETFGSEVVQFCQKLDVNHVTRPMISQLVRSATSIGANYSEANNSSSRKDFRNKAIIAKKESQETEYWLRMTIPCYPEQKLKIQSFSKECHELTLILQSISNKLREK